ncbi:PEBP-like protein [Hymenopellis radicata]|nr:PEBP-like protein [Hymenopellis radicata]
MRTLISILTFLPLVFTLDTPSGVKQAFDDANVGASVLPSFSSQTLRWSSIPHSSSKSFFPQSTGDPITLEVGEQLPRNGSLGVTTAPTSFNSRHSYRESPTFTLIGENIGAGPFVVATVDPDAPTPQAPNIAQVRHFLGGNFITGSPACEAELLVNTTPAISEWQQPTPPAGSDAHRYIFLVFNQPDAFNDQTLVNTATPITLFNISAFGEAVGLGNPIAGNFMLVAPDPA